MPSKLLIAASRKAHDVFEASNFGITAGEVQVDGKAVLQRVRSMRDDFAAVARKSFDEFESHSLIRGRAKFLSPSSLEIDDGTVISAKSVVVATGARPEVPEAFGSLGELCKTHETIFEIDDLPTSLAVVGTGPIGVELAQAFARLGVATALLDESPTIGAVKDQRMHDLLQRELEKELDLILGVEIMAERTAKGAMLNWSGKHDGGRVFDLVLIATGRPPQVASAVGEWIFNAACRQAVEWRVDLPSFRMGVNLFEAQFRSGRSVRDALSETGLPPDGLELELVENILLKDNAATVHLLKELRGLGVGLAFDDYGTGFAALSMLKHYPVSRIKIDRSFVSGVNVDAKDAAVVRALLYLGRSFGLEVIAEGIETQAQVDFFLDGLTREDILATHLEAQGYLFGKPMPAHEFAQKFILLRAA